jgi:hypothetical protein
MASWEELVELDDVQRRTVVGGAERLERAAECLDIERLIRQSGVDPASNLPKDITLITFNVSLKYVCHLPKDITLQSSQGYNVNVGNCVVII